MLKSKIAILLALIMVFAVFATGCNRGEVPANKPEESSSSEPDTIIEPEPEPESEPQSESQSESKPTPPANGGTVITPPSSGTGTGTAANLYISKAGSKVNNKTVTGDVYIQKSVGTGDVYLTDVKVQGTIYVNGGGQNSIYLDNVTAKNLVIDYDNHKVRVVASGKTEIKNTTIKTPAILVEDDLSSSYDGFKDVTTQKAHGYIYLPLELDGARLDSLNARIKTYVEKSGGASMGDTSDSRIDPVEGSPNSGGGGGSSRPTPDTTKPTVSSISTGTNEISFTVSDNVKVTKVEIDSSVYVGDTVKIPDFDFSFNLPISSADSAVAANFGMSVTYSGGKITLRITDYAKFANALKAHYKIADTIFEPSKIHFWVVAHDAAGNASGHMGLADGTPATAQQVDLMLTKPPAVNTVTIDITNPKVGDTLTAGIKPNEALVTKYEWYSGATLIAGATTNKYKVTDADIGNEIKVIVTTIGGVTVTSIETSAVVVAIDTVVITYSDGNPITTLKVGDELKANITPANATNPTYQWYRDDTIIPDANNEFYKIDSNDVKYKIMVKVTTGAYSAKSLPTEVVQPTWGNTVIFSNSLGTATGIGNNLTGQVNVSEAMESAAIQFNSGTKPFNYEVPDGVYEFKLTSLPSGKDSSYFLSYYNAIKPGQGFDTLTIGTPCSEYTSNWQQYMVNTLAINDKTNQTPMFKIKVSGGVYTILDGTQARVDNNAVTAQQGMIIPGNFPAGAYKFSGVVDNKTYIVELLIINSKEWAKP